MPRTFTLDEANRLLADVRRLVPATRDAIHRARTTREELADLESMWRDREPPLGDPANPDTADHERLLADADAAERDARVLLGSLQSLGVEVKDPTLGLVDFPARRGDGIVYLCWQEGEDEIVAWHDLVSGFAGRRPIDEF